MMNPTTLHLAPDFFSENERPLIESGPFSASTFLYETGVAALRLGNEQGELIMLPFQGQQIWSATFGGRNITMKSMFDQPNATQNYLNTYGGFMLHCGALTMGVPAKEDNHPLHGELPNAPYRKAQVILGEDEGGHYIGLSGEYQHTIAFTCNYVARPLVKLYAGASTCHISISIENLKKTPMELMYMAHVNFRPVDNSRLVYSAPCTPEHARVRKSIPSHVRPTPEYLAFLQELQRNPKQHNTLRPDLAFDPEVVFTLDYQADQAGWAHTMQVHPDGNADYIRHRPAQLDQGVRWICRTPDQDALGMVLPATAEPEGYAAEKAKGHVKMLAGGASFTCEMEAGVLNTAQAAQMETKISNILG
ncbi:aldose 1-epimerase family protein [soil metagenome]